MAKIDEFIKKATNEEWDTLSVRRKACTTPEQKKAFASMYGFTPEGIRAYEVMHYLECKKNQQNIETLVQENEALREKVKELEKTTNQVPGFRKMTGKSVKHSFYATQTAIDKFEALVDTISDSYGYKKYLAASFVLEEVLKVFCQDT